MKRVYAAVAGAACLVLSGSVCLASSDDVLAFAKEDLLKCIHPTVKGDKTTAEIDKPAITAGDVTTTRVKIFYSGWLKKNVLVLEVAERAGKPTLTKVRILEDTGTGGRSHCKYLEGWQEMSVKQQYASRSVQALERRIQWALAHHDGPYGS
jgi:hypothetical protein